MFGWFSNPFDSLWGPNTSGFITHSTYNVLQVVEENDYKPALAVNPITHTIYSANSSWGKASLKVSGSSNEERVGAALQDLRDAWRGITFELRENIELCESWLAKGGGIKVKHINAHAAIANFLWYQAVCMPRPWEQLFKISLVVERLLGKGTFGFAYINKDKSFFDHMQLVYDMADLAQTIGSFPITAFESLCLGKELSAEDGVRLAEFVAALHIKRRTIPHDLLYRCLWRFAKSKVGSARLLFQGITKAAEEHPIVLFTRKMPYPSSIVAGMEIVGESGKVYTLGASRGVSDGGNERFSFSVDGSPVEGQEILLGKNPVDLVLSLERYKPSERSFNLHEYLEDGWFARISHKT